MKVEKLITSKLKENGFHDWTFVIDDEPDEHMSGMIRGFISDRQDDRFIIDFDSEGEVYFTCTDKDLRDKAVLVFDDLVTHKEHKEGVFSFRANLNSSKN